MIGTRRTLAPTGRSGWILLVAILFLAAFGCSTAPISGVVASVNDHSSAGENGDEKNEEEKDGDGDESGSNGNGGIVLPIDPTLAADLVKVQSQLADLQVSVGEVRNFEKSARSALEEIQTSVDTLKETVAGSEARLGNLEKLVAEAKTASADLEKIREEATRELNLIRDDQEASAEAVNELIDRVDGIGGETESMVDRIDMLTDGKASSRHGHEEYLPRIDFKDWTGETEQYTAPQPRLWHLAMAASLSLMIGAIVFWLARKAILPAYSSLNQIQAKVNALVSRQKGGGGGPQGGE